MGFFDKVKRAVTGPVAIDIAVPATFSWTDQSLTVTTDFTNETDKPLVMAEVRFTLGARTSGDRKGPTSKLKLTVPGPLVLDPGMTVQQQRCHLGRLTDPALLSADPAVQTTANRLR